MEIVRLSSSLVLASSPKSFFPLDARTLFGRVIMTFPRLHTHETETQTSCPLPHPLLHIKTASTMWYHPKPQHPSIRRYNCRRPHRNPSPLLFYPTRSPFSALTSQDLDLCSRISDTRQIPTPPSSPTTRLRCAGACFSFPHHMKLSLCRRQLGIPPYLLVLDPLKGGPVRCTQRKTCLRPPYDSGICSVL